MDANNNDIIRYYDLSKEERKALTKEFYKTEEGKKTQRLSIILASIFILVTIVTVTISIVNHDGTPTYVSAPSTFMCAFPAIIASSNMQKWLLAEKNITMERAKKEKKKKS